MKISNKINKSNVFLVILICVSILILPKWILSYYFFDENIVLRIIHEVGDAAYFPIISSFSDLNFSNSYSLKLEKLNLISFPIISLLINSFFFKILGSYSFIFLELVCAFVFLLIFNKIFLELNFSKITSLTISLLLYLLPSLISDLKILDINFINLFSLNFDTFYSTRFPRPAIANLFFFTYIFFLIKFAFEKEYKKYLIAIFILMGLTINIFFYLFFIQFFSLVLIFILKFKKNFLNEILNRFTLFLSLTLILIFFITIFQTQTFLSEPDAIKRMGVFNVDYDKKKILVNYFLNFISNINFIFVFLTNIIFFIFFKKKSTKIFFYLFLASILSPIFFFLVMNKGIDYYHFFNWIIVLGFIYPFISSLYFFEVRFFKSLNLSQTNITCSIIIIILLFYSVFNTFLLSKSHVNNFLTKRQNINETTNFILNNEISDKKNLEILNLNYEMSIWLILNDYKNLSIVPVSFWTPKTDEILENEFFSTLKFLNFNLNEFKNLIENKKKGWRFKNEFVFNFFSRKYMANELVYFNDDISDYEEIEKKFIKSNNILITHQVIIPISENKRLLNKFKDYNNKIDPDIVIADKISNLIKYKFDKENFCLTFSNNKFDIFVKKKLRANCISKN